MTELAFLSAAEQAALVRNKEVSPVELTELYLDRIEKLDGDVNAWVTVVPEMALETAREAEAAVASGDELGPLHGVPISIKDLNETAGIKTTFSSKAFADFVPDWDCSTVTRIKGAGAVILGKTNTPEFGTPPATESELNGACRNPWNLDLSPGGSSGGAAAALAAGMCPISQGSDGGGSIRIPSSVCGLFGIKPARGRVSHAPLMGDALNGLSTDGPIARTVQDAALLLDVMEGYETGDPYWAPPPQRPFVEEVGADPGKLRIAFTAQTPNGEEVHPDCVVAMEGAAKLLQSLGHSVEEAAPDWFHPELVHYFVTVWQAAYGYHQVPLEQLEPLNRALAETALQSTSPDYTRAVMELQAISRKIVALWDDYDVLLTPTLALPPRPVGWMLGEEDPWVGFAKAGAFTPFTPVINVTGQPAVSVPLHWSDDNLPIGVHLIGRPADEATLIRISSQLEEARPWKDRRPPVS
jgi:amidase